MESLENLEKFFNAILMLMFIISLIWFLFQPAKFGLLVGYSMTPAMTDGDIFIYNPGEPADVNDVAIFTSKEHGGKLVSHRIVKKNETHYVTKGDNNTYRDDPLRINGDNYQGRMIDHIATPWEFPIDQDKMLQIDNPLYRIFAN